MESIAKMDIFFLVTTVVVALVGLLAIILMVYAIKFIRDARQISRLLREETIEVIDDIEEFRRDVKHKASRLSSLLKVITTARFIKKVLKPKQKEDND